MGFLNLFKKAPLIVSNKKEYLPTLHPDVASLIWYAEGPLKNYDPKADRTVFRNNQFSVEMSTHEEPSAIYFSVSITTVSNPFSIRPDYFPRYKELTPEQRFAYIEFLKNPYDPRFDIGFVFLLFYGLERHLLNGQFDQALKVILKLRDVHQYLSFQRYSANAIIIGSMLKGTPQHLMTFYDSLDKEYEFKFSDALYLLLVYGLEGSLSAKDLMRMSKTFGFNNQHYIKDYTSIFEKNLRNNLIDKYQTDTLILKKFIEPDLSLIKAFTETSFANTSLKINIKGLPLLQSSPILTQTIYQLLSFTHEATKKEVQTLLKSGDLNTKMPTPKPKVIPIIDRVLETQYLNALGFAKTLLEKHFALMNIHEFYYKYRELDGQYIEICEKYCLEYIYLLKDLYIEYITTETKRLKNHLEMISNYHNQEANSIRTRTIDELNQLNVKGFMGHIVSFDRLVIIYQKQRQIQKAIEICEKAINHYQNKNQEYLTKFLKLKDKLLNKEANY
jgi:hypothetical protein